MLLLLYSKATVSPCSTSATKLIIILDTQSSQQLVNIYTIAPVVVPILKINSSDLRY